MLGTWFRGLFFSTAAVGAFQSSMLVSFLLAVLCYMALRLCFLILGIHASGISIPLSLLMSLGWSLMRITINKLNLIPKGKVSGVVGML